MLQCSTRPQSLQMRCLMGGFVAIIISLHTQTCWQLGSPGFSSIYPLPPLLRISFHLQVSSQTSSWRSSSSALVLRGSEPPPVVGAASLSSSMSLSFNIPMVSLNSRTSPNPYDLNIRSGIVSYWHIFTPASDLEGKRIASCSGHVLRFPFSVQAGRSGCQVLGYMLRPAFWGVGGEGEAGTNQVRP